MLFTSAVFLVFFVTVYAVYLLLACRHRAQNVLLLAANYVFYGWWDWRFLSLLLLTTLVDFGAGMLLGRVTRPGGRRGILVAALTFNLGMLGFFKYFHFFTDSAVSLLTSLGFHADAPTIRILLPLGISFYTFQAVSYVVDVYRGKTKPTGSLTEFAIYVAFFPLLISGPIERSDHLLPQIAAPRKVTLAQVNAGIFLILWGLYKKLVIADNIGQIADEIFDGYLRQDGLNVLLGAIAFAFQVYCDFSGYTDIARGLAKMMGFDLILNFRLPYFALSPSEFWRRWHISLSTWLRDYLYIPLGGNRGTESQTLRNLMITMLLGGLWHGAAWNFVLWGAYHGVILVIYRLVAPDLGTENPWRSRYSALVVLPQMALMFSLTLVGWFLFRAESFPQIGHMLTHAGFQTGISTFPLARKLAFFVAPLILVQVVQYVRQDLLAPLRFPLVLQAAFYAFLVLMMLMFGNMGANEFIYFQF